MPTGRPSKLAGRVALVVGAGSDFGRAAAMALAPQGARLALNDLLPNPIERLAAEIEAKGGHAAVYAEDLSKKLALQTALQHILEDLERIDILVFAAGVGPRDPILDMDEWHWRHALDLNLNAAFLTMQSVGRVMRELGGGVMALGIPPAGGSAALASGAAALEGLAGAAAKEFAAHNIRVGAVPSGETEQAVQDLMKLIDTQFSTPPKEKPHG